MKNTIDHKNKQPIIGDEGTVRYRTLTGPVAVIAKIISYSIPTFGLIYLTGLNLVFKINFPSQVYLPMFLGLSVVLVFMLLPFSKKNPQNTIPWYDWIFIGGTAVATIYPAANYKAIFLAGTFGVSDIEMLMGAIMIIAVLEAVRRTTGLAMVVVVVFFLIHARFANYFPELLLGPNSSSGQVMRFVYLSDQGIFGFILAVGATIILAFLLFGNLLSMRDGGQKFMDVALSLVGKTKGGIAKVSVVSSSLLGSISGSPTANVMITGSFTIPAMKKNGYKPVFAGAVEATASTGGLIAPPVMGAVAFVAGDITGLGYSKIAIAAIIPALLYFLAVFMQIHFRACKDDLSGFAEEIEIPRLLPALKNAWTLFLPFAVLIVLLLVIQYSPERSALIATAAIVIIRLVAERIPLKAFIDAVENTSRNLMEVIPIISCAGIIVGSVSLTGLGINISTLILTIAGGSTILLIIYSGLASYILGMGVSGIASYIVLATLVAPAMVEAGIPLLAAHMFLIYIGASMFFTPPYAPAAYAAGTLANASPISVGFQAMRLGIVAYLVPVVICYNTSLLLEGTSVFSIATSVVTAIIGVVIMAAALEGYLLTKLNIFQRILMAGGGILSFVPGSTTDLLGMLIVVVIVISNVMQKRNEKRASLVQ